MSVTGEPGQLATAPGARRRAPNRRGGGAVDVIVPAGIDDPRRPSGGNRYDRRLCQEMPALGWSVHELAVPGSWPHPDAAARGALARALTSGAEDAVERPVVLVDGLIAAAAADLVVAAAGTRPVAVLVHMPLGPAVPELMLAERDVLTQVAAVVTTSHFTRRYLIGAYRLPADRIHVATPGADRAGMRCRSDTAGQQGTRLLCVAAVTRGKGYDVLLAALAQLAAAGSATPTGESRDAVSAGLDWRCSCVGSHDIDPEFAARIRENALDARLAGWLHFAGPLTGAALEAAYTASDLLVLPSRAETWGMVVTEALAHGMPVIASDVGGVPEALGRAPDGSRPGLLVPPGEPQALATAIGRWLQDRALRGRLRAAARARQRLLPGWDRTAALIAAVLAECAAGRTAAG